MTENQPPRNTAAEAARAYLQRGWMPTKLIGKRAVWTDWPKRVITEDEIDGLFGGSGVNVGLLHGPISAHLVDVDLDCPEAVRAAPLILPETPMRHGRKGSGLAHYWYVSEGARTTRYKDPAAPSDQASLVELLGEGTQSMVPPSLHPSGENVCWCQGVKFEPPKVRPGVLLKACARLAAVSLIARHWTTGDRSEAAMHLGGWWAKSGVPVEDAEQLMRAVCQAAQDEEPSGRITSVRHSYEAHSAGKTVAGWQGLIERFGDDVMRQTSAWLGLKGHTGASRGTRGTGGRDGKLRCGVNSYRYELVNELDCTDSGNASRLLVRYGENLLYCAAWKSWLVWHGARWQRDETLETRLMACRVARDIVETAASETDDDKKATLAHWAAQSANAGRIDAMLELAASSRKVAVRPEDLDRHPDLLNVANGTLDLSEARLIDAEDDNPHRPSARGDRLTLQAPVEHDPAAQCPRWLEFLGQIFDNDGELIRFVQRLAGYCLVAGNPEQYIVIMHGSGANGKSTLLETLKAVLGDYAATVAPEVLMSADSGGNNQLYALASLRAARLVTASETEDGRQLAESLIKTMTGSEAIMAREPYGAPFEFTPAFTPFLATNHKPQVKDTSEGMWRRVLLVPFLVTIPRELRDPRLPERLQLELPGILNWMIDGLLDYYDRRLDSGRGLQPPAAVRVATDDYRADQDILAEYLEDCCEITGDPADRAAKGDIFKDYENWCELNSGRAVTANTFGRKLKAREGISESKSGSTRYWNGIRCKNFPSTRPLSLGGPDG